MNSLRLRPLVIGLIVFSLPLSLSATTTKVGNGDDGRDLEKLSPITSGIFSDTKMKASQLLKQMHVEGIAGLGQLLPEIEQSTLMLADSDVSASLPADQTAFHSDMRGLVFARTFPESHAATRFFPIAKNLNEQQLIALHIHEGLHRSLPEKFRENESIVGAITLSITSPGATHDRIRQTVSQWVPQETVVIVQQAPVNYPSNGYPGSMTGLYPMPSDARIKRPSEFGYSYRYFQNPVGDKSVNHVASLQSIQSFLYPFGSDEQPIGIGIDLSFIKMGEQSNMGPLGLSARMRLWSARGFDVGIWGEASLNTLSNEELKNSPMGRDVFTIGLSARRDLNHFYVENLLGYSAAGVSHQMDGGIDNTYTFGSVVQASVHAGGRFGAFQLGLFGEIYLADNFRAQWGDADQTIGRFQIVTAGPELSYTYDSLTLSIFGRTIVSSTSDATFDYIGNLMKTGVGTGNIGASLKISL